MTQEEKQLLLKDLCARLPYRVKAQYNKKEIFGDVEQIEAGGDIDLSYYDEEAEKWKLCCTSIDNIKPYLRPMSSMTDEERKELQCLVGPVIYDEVNNTIVGFECNTLEQLTLLENWLNFHHFDYRGLIGKGLALEAPEGMYKTE